MKRIYDKSISFNYSSIKNNPSYSSKCYHNSIGSKVYDKWTDTNYKSPNDPICNSTINENNNPYSNNTASDNCSTNCTHCNTICDCYNLYNYNTGKDKLSIMKGESAEFDLISNDCEIRVDTNITTSNDIILWGEIKNNYNEPAENVLVTLLKPQYYRGVCQYIKIACTKTDYCGTYSFLINEKDYFVDYKITLGTLV